MKWVLYVFALLMVIAPVPGNAGTVTDWNAAKITIPAGTARQGYYFVFSIYAATAEIALTVWNPQVKFQSGANGRVNLDLIHAAAAGDVPLAIFSRQPGGPETGWYPFPPVALAPGEHLELYVWIYQDGGPEFWVKLGSRLWGTETAQ